MTTKFLDDGTIVAIATPPGEGGVGVVRLSGPNAVVICDVIFRSKCGRPASTQKSHTVRFGWAVEGKGSGKESLIDEALLLIMRSPKSYTGEDVAEISAHGGNALLKRIVAEAVRAGARLAEKGEFTKRAFLNGRIDLTHSSKR